MFAKEIMTTSLITVTPDTSVNDIAQLLIKNNISAIPVVNTQGMVIGMVSEGDLRKKASNAAPEECKAYQLMASPVITAEENTKASEIAHLLTEHHIKHVPIIKDNRIVGIVSRADIVKAFILLSDKTSHAYMPEHGDNRRH